MYKLRHFLYLNYLNFKFPVYYCGIVSVLCVMFMNFCFTQYNEFNIESKILNELDYTNIYEASFSLPEDHQYEQLKEKLMTALKGNAVLLNYRRNPLYTTLKNNHIVSIRVISAQEADFFHIFNEDGSRSSTNTYSVIVPDGLKKHFKPGCAYRLPIGIYVHENTWEINIKVVRSARDIFLLSSDYNSLDRVQDELLIFDPNNTLPLHLSPFSNAVFSFYLYIIDYEKTIHILEEYPFIQIKNKQEKIACFPEFDLQRLPSYFKFMILTSCIYILLSVNFYVLFYYKKKKDIMIFNYCNLTRKFYLQCIGILTMLQLCFGFMIGQLLWYCYCICSRTIYWHNESIFLPFLVLIHLCIFIFLNRGYNHLARTYH